ncbi:aldo keto reductase [Trichoderma arundinaceum]|uniref:Aldo keto reductase n=1 Tax=Trichoderma arundinaceum TaxID=490622 RepID=A0A395NXK9_TRIAR|nr:aldo keto reductase [Trichoderma arundinaceum]
MVGHVNMMDDVLISNLPPEVLRSSLRTLLSRGSANQQLFVQHVQSQHIESGLRFTEPLILFPDADIVSEACVDYISKTRCLFSANMAWNSIAYLSHFVKAIVIARASWSPSSPLSQVFDHFSGDVVQATQALKESHPQRSIVLRVVLKDLLTAFADCLKYCSTMKLIYPFHRPQRQVHDALITFFPAEAKISLSGSSNNRIIAPGTLYASLPEGTSIETVQLGQYDMPRLFNGLWQLSSPAWGAGTTDEHEKALVQLVESGLVATDMADHYGDAELVYGDFRNKLPKDVSDKVFAITKWCVFKAIEKPITADFVLEQVKERSRRLGGRVELLQFHWYDFNDKNYLDILLHLVNIAKTHPQLVSAIGLCNFDAKHTDEACEFLKEKTGSVGIVSNQVQFSLLDSRPLKNMIPICQKHNIKLLTYGSFCGGFLSEAWLTQPPPELYSSATSTSTSSASMSSATKRLTPSQRKYLDVIRSWGPWYDFQVLLGLLFSIAAKHGVAIHNVATRWVLQQPSVASVIIGTSLGTSSSNGSPPPGTPPGGHSVVSSPVLAHRSTFSISSPSIKHRNSVTANHGHRSSTSFSSNKRASWGLSKRNSFMIPPVPPVKARATENLRVFGWELDEEDMRIINAAALGKDGEKTDMLFAKLGDCGDEYRNAD